MIFGSVNLKGMMGNVDKYCVMYIFFQTIKYFVLVLELFCCVDENEEKE